MRSRTECRRRLLLLAALICTASPGAGAAQARAPASLGQSAAAAATQPDDAQIEAALRRVKADPNLGSERRIHALRWQSSPESTSSWKMPGWLKWLQPVTEGIVAVFGWIVGAASWLAESGRVLLWVAAAVLVGLLAVYLARFLKVHGGPRTAGRFAAPSFVRELDIRPESLPEDVGAAAQRLWASGDQRGALALLYRGLLSRLVHVHGVPIRDSSTEGDCLALAQGLGAAQRSYATRLIRSWQLAVYGAQIPDELTVRDLCERFSASLDPPPDPVEPHAAAQGA